MEYDGASTQRFPEEIQVLSGCRICTNQDSNLCQTCHNLRLSTFLTADPDKM